MENHTRSLTSDKLQQVIRACNNLHLADPSSSFLHHCHDTLSPLLGNVHFATEIYQLDPLQLKYQEIHTLDHERWIPLFLEHIHDHPYAKRLAETPASEIGMTHTESGVTSFRKSALYNEFYDQVDAQNQLWIGIVDGNELFNCVYSRDKEYTEAQLAMLCMIQPHLESAWKNWKRARTLRQELDILKGSINSSEKEARKAAGIRRTFEALTPRQREVAELVAHGYDNQHVADTLHISVWTVKKHMQAVFQTLDILHRTELAAKWIRAYPVQLPR